MLDFTFAASNFALQRMALKQPFLILVLIAMVVAGRLWARPSYRHYKESRAVTRAQKFLAAADYANASLTARQALHVNPSNVEACKIMVQLAELVGPSRVLDWRGRLAALSPTLENRLSLAAAAIRLEASPCPIAPQTLGALALSVSNSPAYHVLCAELALKQNQPAEAERHLLDACSLETTNTLHQLNLAVLRLCHSGQLSSNLPVVLAAGLLSTVSGPPFGSNQLSSPVLVAPDIDNPRAVLERLRTDPAYAAVALRSLTADALVRTNLQAAEHYSRQLLSQTQASLSDNLQHLSILHQLASPQFQPFLQSVQELAKTNARAVYSLASWLTANGSANAALQWLTNFPVNLQSAMPVPLAIGDALVSQRNWTGLERFLEGKAWAHLDFVRFAWLSRAAWEQKQLQAADAHWRMAVQQASAGLEPLTWLTRVSEQSGQQPEPLLWRIVHQHPTERWPWFELQRIYAKTRNTSGLNLLYSEMGTWQPKNFIAKNNFAATSMLLKRNPRKAHDTARELYSQRPDDPVIASTYAYSLHLQGHTRKGLAVLERCPTTALESPVVALYYGVLLAADGQTSQAARFLALGQRAELLPEERTLALEAFTQGANRRSLRE